MIALTTGLQCAKKIGGMIGLSGYLPFAEQLVNAETSKFNQSTPIFLGHGTEDAIVPCALGRAGYDVLEKNHYVVSWHQYAMPHSVCSDEINDISAWLRKIFV